MTTRKYPMGIVSEKGSSGKKDSSGGWVKTAQ